MPSSSASSSSSSSSESRRKRKRERKEKKEKKRERKKEKKRDKKRRKHEKHDDPPGPSKLPLVSANATADEFCVGDAVLYTARDGSHKHATIVKVHTDDVVPYFTVSVDGAEKQTERSRLTKPKPKPIYRISKVPKPPPAAPPAPAIDDLGRLQRALAGGAAAAAEPPREPPRRVLGAQRPEDAAAERERLQQIQRVWDPSLGVYRSVRLSGEVVEESVSRGEQQRLMAAKARHVGPVGPTAAQSFTGREKFPSQHPWFGYK